MRIPKFRELKGHLKGKCAAKTPVVSQLGVSVFAICMFMVSASSTAQATSYYVDKVNGTNGDGKTLAAAFTTISQAAAVAQAGDTINVVPAIYRENVNLTNAGTSSSPIILRPQGSGTPELRGSDVVTGWTLYSGSIWKKTGWTTKSQQVFVDFNASTVPQGTYSSQVLKQYGTPLVYAQAYASPGNTIESMTASSFFHDSTNNTLYVWLADNSDPNNHNIEVSVRPRMLSTSQYATIQGFRFAHCNSSGDPSVTQHGYANGVSIGNYSRLENSTIEWCDFAALSGGGGIVVENCILRSNGAVGQQIGGWQNQTLRNSKILYNRYRPYNPSDHAGGVKWIPQVTGLIEGCEVAYNHGSGLWMDYCNSTGVTTIRGNYVHDNDGGNGDAAIKLEGSNNIKVYNNVVANNSNKGIYMLGGINNEIQFNTITGTKMIGTYSSTENGALMVAVDLSRSLLVDTLTIRNNNIADNLTSKDLAIPLTDGTYLKSVVCDYNNLYNSLKTLMLFSGSNYQSGGTNYNTVATWATASGRDTHSLSVDPKFADGAGALKYALKNSSGLRGAGTAVSSITTDYAGTNRATPPVIGAFEGILTVGSGSIGQDVWTGVSGNYVSQIPLTTTPNQTYTLTEDLEGVHTGYNYGTRIRGYITAPITGNYIFWLTSDNTGELYLSTNEYVTSKSKIADVPNWTTPRNWTAYPNQKSLPISLVAGEKYYVEVLSKQELGDSNVAVGWSKPGESTSAPGQVVPGSQLSPYTAPIGIGTGLTGKYYNDKTLTNLVKTQIDPLINFDWGYGAPKNLDGTTMSSVGPTNFSVLWTGQVQAIEAGNYIFQTTSDDGVRLYLNGATTPQINKWIDQSSTSYTTALNMTVGQKIDVRMDYYQATGGAKAILSWIRPGGSTAVLVPQTQLYP